MAAAGLIRRNPNPSFLRQLLHSRLLSTSTTTQTETLTPGSISRLKSSIRSERNPDRLASLFVSSVSVPSVLGDRSLYRLTVARLAAAGRQDLVTNILSSTLSSSPSPPSHGLLLRLISLYSQAGLLDSAVATFGLVRPPSDQALCALLAAFFDNGEFHRCIDSFHRLPAELGITPSVATHNVYLKALVANGDVATARKALDEMPARGVKPDIVSCNEILQGYLKNDNEDAFREFLKEIVSVRHLKPNVATYNLRIAALCAKGKNLEAEELLSAMASKGVPPNRASFNTLIAAFVKEGDAEAALRVFKQMPNVKRPNGTGVSPNFETYIKLLKGLVEKGVLGPAIEVHNECLEKKWAPPFQVVKGLVDGLVKSARLDEAREVVDTMRNAVKGDAAIEWKKVEAEFSL